MLSLPFKIAVSPTLKIRSIIATRDMKKNEIIERCPVILLDRKQEEALKQTVLWKYYFEWDETHHAIVLGYGALINHSFTPNARYIHDYKNMYLVFKAFKNISKGVEIMVNYNYYPNNQDKLETFLLDFNEHFPEK